jgi:hypothetical protein
MKRDVSEQEYLSKEGLKSDKSRDTQFLFIGSEERYPIKEGLKETSPIACTVAKNSTVRGVVISNKRRIETRTPRIHPIFRMLSEKRYPIKEGLKFTRRLEDDGL